MVDRLIWADYAILAILGLSVLMSLWRGFLREAISLASWVGAFVLAFHFSDRVAVLLEGYVSVPSVRQMLAFGAVVVVALFAGGLVNIVVGRIVDGTGLGPTDRMVGVVFGAARGVAIVAVLVLLAGLTPVPRDPWWSQSIFLPHFQELALTLKAYLPPELAQGIRFQ